MEKTTEEDLALFSVQHVSGVEANSVDTRLEELCHELITVPDGKAQCRIINWQRETRIRTLINGA
jgi:hypothetical protein